MTSIYNTGTVSVTNGSAAVTGIGTAWALGLVSGGIMSIEAPGNAMPILSVTDNTHLTGAVVWTGATGTYNYAIDLQGSDAANVIDLNTTLSRVLVTLSLAGITPNSSGTLTDRAALTLGMGDKGYIFLYAEVGYDFQFYRWNGTAWDGPFAFKGANGTPGVGTGGYGLPTGGTAGQFLRKSSGTDGDAAFATIAASSVTNDSSVAGTTTKDALNTLSTVARRGTVRAATTANITISTALNAASVIDGVTLVAGDLVLVKNQTAPETNGVYVVGVTPVRSPEYATYNQHPGSLIVVQEGTTQADTFWYCSSNVGGTLNTTAIAWSQMSLTAAANSITNAQLVNVSTATIKGRASAGTGSPEDLTPSQLSGLLAAAGLMRTVATAAVTLYVGYNLGAVTIPIASPAVANLTAHGLTAGSRVSFSIQPNKKPATISVASPAVVTMANSFVAGQPIVFETTSALPTGVVAGTTYYVSATGLSGSSFQISATSGGASINTTAPTVTITNASPGVFTEGSAHGLSVGDLVTLATTGTLPTGLSPATQYFVKTVPLSTTYTLSATPEGAAINTSSAGSGTHTRVQAGTHYLSESGVLPTGVTAGQDYYVLATGLTSNAFQFAATAGGSAINATGSTSGTILAKTGSDSNTGLVNSAAGAFLTLQAAWNALATYDLNIQTATVQLAKGTYLTGLVANSMPLGGASLTIQGDATSIATQSNYFIDTTSSCLVINSPLQCGWTIRGLRMRYTGSGLSAVSLNGAGTIATSNNEYMGGSTGFAGALSTQVQGAKIIVSTNSIWSGSGSAMFAAASGIIQFFGVTINILNYPTWSWNTCSASALSKISVSGVTWNGYAKGQRYNVFENSVLTTNGGGATFIPGSSAGTSSGGLYI